MSGRPPQPFRQSRTGRFNLNERFQFDYEEYADNEASAMFLTPWWAALAPARF